MSWILGAIIFWFIFLSSILFALFWLIRTAKSVLFYLYLWQLKEYHIGRFVDHFRTAQGKKLIFSKLIGIKIALFSVFTILFQFSLFDPATESYLLGYTFLAVLLVAFTIAVTVYFLEIVKWFRDIKRKALRAPVLTKKTFLLIGIIFSIQIVFFGVFVFHETVNFVSAFLAFDILAPIIVSAIVLAFQPFTALSRKIVLSRAKAKRDHLDNLKVVGITGSYGKTSTKEFLTHMLSQKFQVLKTPEHQNSEVGIANTILKNLKDEHAIFVCEMGAYNKGGIELLANIIKPDIGIVTGANEQHLATFGSMENLLSAEGGEELIRALPKNGIAIINGGSGILKNHIPKLKEANSGVSFIVTFEDVVAEDVKIEKEKVSFIVQGTQFHAPSYGGHNVENILLAIIAAKELGMNLEEIAKACKTMPAELGALKLKRGIHGLNIIDSIYSANPDGVIADLEYLSLYDGKKIIVMPCLIELGKASKEVHKRIGEKINTVCDLAIITTKECFDDVKEGAKEKEVLFLENSQEILEKIKNITENKESTVLLEGGKESIVQRQLMRSLTQRE